MQRSLKSTLLSSRLKPSFEHKHPSVPLELSVILAVLRRDDSKRSYFETSRFEQFLNIVLG